MNIFTLEAILSQTKNLFSSERFAALGRVVLLFFSTDYFIQYNVQWKKLGFDLDHVDSRTIQLLYFIAVWVIIWWVIYRLLRLPLRLIFHGKIKSGILKTRKEIVKQSQFEMSKVLLEVYSKFIPFIQRFGFRLGFINSNNLHEPLNFDISEKEEGFNEAMLFMYRWMLTVLHTLLVVIIVWQFYAWWLFLIILIVLIASVLYTVAIAILILNIEVLEVLRLKLLKENKKHWK